MDIFTIKSYWPKLILKKYYFNEVMLAKDISNMLRVPCTICIKSTYYLKAIFLNLSPYLTLRTAEQVTVTIGVWSLHLN
jgi:hypothetical protein